MGVALYSDAADADSRIDPFVLVDSPSGGSIGLSWKEIAETSYSGILGSTYTVEREYHRVTVFGGGKKKGNGEDEDGASDPDGGDVAAGENEDEPESSPGPGDDDRPASPSTSTSSDESGAAAPGNSRDASVGSGFLLSFATRETVQFRGPGPLDGEYADGNNSFLGFVSAAGNRTTAIALHVDTHMYEESFGIDVPEGRASGTLEGYEVTTGLTLAVRPFGPALSLRAGIDVTWTDAEMKVTRRVADDGVPVTAGNTFEVNREDVVGYSLGADLVLFDSWSVGVFRDFRSTEVFGAHAAIRF